MAETFGDRTREAAAAYSEFFGISVEEAHDHIWARVNPFGGSHYNAHVFAWHEHILAVAKAAVAPKPNGPA